MRQCICDRCKAVIDDNGSSIILKVSGSSKYDILKVRYDLCPNCSNKIANCIYAGGGEKQKFFVDETGKVTPLPEIVRCKDCKYQVDRGRRFKECDKHFLWAKDDWFCADGERKEEE